MKEQEVEAREKRTAENLSKIKECCISALCLLAIFEEKESEEEMEMAAV